MTPYVAVGIPPIALKRFRVEKRLSNNEGRSLHIISTVCDVYNLSIDDLAMDSRKRELVQCRQLIMYLLSRFTKLTLKKIGSIFNRHYSTVIYAIGTMEDILSYNQKFRTKVSSIEKVI